MGGSVTDKQSGLASDATLKPALNTMPQEDAMSNHIDVTSTPEYQSPRERYEAIITRAARGWKVSVAEIKGRSGVWPITAARFDCYAELHDVGLTSVRIGRLLNRDPSTVRTALMKIRKHRAKDQ